MKLDIPDTLTQQLADSVTETVGTVRHNEDIRLGLADLGGLNQKFRSVADICDSAETRFLSLIVHTMLGHTQDTYDGKPDQWYKLNASNIVQFKPHFLKFLEGLKEAVVKKDLDAATRVAIKFFHEYHKLARRTTLARSR